MDHKCHTHSEWDWDYGVGSGPQHFYDIVCYGLLARLPEDQSFVSSFGTFYCSLCLSHHMNWTWTSLLLSLLAIGLWLVPPLPVSHRLMPRCRSHCWTQHRSCCWIQMTETSEVSCCLDQSQSWLSCLLCIRLHLFRSSDNYYPGTCIGDI